MSSYAYYFTVVLCFDCVRCFDYSSLAFSVGRGMLTLSSLEPLLAERLPIPPLMLSGRVPPTNATITLDTSTSSADLMLWPEFHNGVAAGLRVRNGNVKWREGRAGITRNWILYNRSTSLLSDSGASATMTQSSADNSHAGKFECHHSSCSLFISLVVIGALLAFGLLGHLKVLTTADICEYLLKVTFI